ncbi:MAG: clostripain-related cysteine peptidase [Candidatus Riflebacteria bacterium]|nr:clostripain-related cysteine peptidase [Candidatus Riflebacteria bacterium]
MKRIFSVMVVVLLACAFCAPASAAQKEWTFMVFLNADNNLDSFGVGDLEEMVKAGGSNENINVICLLDREHGPATLNYVTKDGAQVIGEPREVDMGDYKEYVKFVVDTAKAYPAKHYCSVIWNHGSGWKDAKGEIIKGISYDDESGNHITTNQLTVAFKDIEAALGKKLDVFCFDACLMQMIEVAYAMKDGCDYLVASEETEPGQGYPYFEIISGFKKDMTPEVFAKHVVKEYAASYNGGSAGNSSTTQSALKCSEINNLRDAINGYCKAIIAGNYGAECKAALNSAQKFYYRTNIDLGHFVSLTKNSIKDESFQTAANKLQAALNKTIVLNGLSGYNTKNATGLAIYFPASSYSFSAEYKDLAFAKDTMWEAMVKDYYKKTTAKQLVAEVSNGDLSGLMNYVATANEKNREVSADLIAKMNFRVFTEGGIDEATQTNVKNMLGELKNK